MEQQQISAKKQKALDKVKRANAELAKVVREEKEQLRKAQDRHKYMMGGCVVKYFPEAYDFSEQEMNRIIACAFSLKDVKNMINTVLKDLIPEQKSAVVDNDTCASSLPASTITRTIGKTTYIANLHFKEQGQTFSQKLKRVLKADSGAV